jgi:hypothetical protein
LQKPTRDISHSIHNDGEQEVDAASGTVETVEKRRLVLLPLVPMRRRRKRK